MGQNQQSQQDQHRHHFALPADGAFGASNWNPTGALAPFSRASWAGASNLLDKAVRSLAQGDRDRCISLVDRAARLPFDDHEQAAPAALAGHMLLFSAITDVLEHSGEDDSTWADAVAAVAATSPVEVQQELRHVLAAIVQDYHLGKQEAKVLRATINRLPEGVELRNRGTMEPTELGAVVVQLVEATVAYFERLCSVTMS